jgi:predicted nucleic acid-binding protein
VILADTSIWIDFLRGAQPRMKGLLDVGQIAMHPFVLAEIALGSLKSRQRTLPEIAALWQVKTAEFSEVMSMIEAHRLYSRGLGLTDAHLIASCLITPGLTLWTRDAALDAASNALGIQAILP